WCLITPILFVVPFFMFTCLRTFYICLCSSSLFFLFFFNDTATTEIYTLSLHDALPIYIAPWRAASGRCARISAPRGSRNSRASTDRKSTRLNSSHQIISYAVFCLKKKKKKKN